jgi:hypothetical protein
MASNVSKKISIYSESETLVTYTHLLSWRRPLRNLCVIKARRVFHGVSGVHGTPIMVRRRAEFRHGQEGQLPRALTKRGAPQMKDPTQRQTTTRDPLDNRASTR